MHRLDYELGLASDDYSNAGGSAQLVACNTKCVITHPFNKGKREACKVGCAAQFAVRQEAVNPTPTPYVEPVPDYTAPPPLPPPPNPNPTGGVGTGGNTGVGGTQSQKAGLGTGAIIGIVIGGVALLGIVGYLVLRKK